MIAYNYIEQLFKAVLVKSISIQGRLHLCPMWGVEINSDTLGEVIKDLVQPAIGNKYPLALLMPPRSSGEYIDAYGEWESYLIDMFFLQTSYYANNQVKSINPNTRTSTYTIQTDWDDMKKAAVNFISVLNKVMRANNLHNISFRLNSDKKTITPVSNIGADRASGVRIQFPVSLFAGCLLEDYNLDDIPAIVVPT